MLRKLLFLDRRRRTCDDDPSIRHQADPRERPTRRDGHQRPVRLPRPRSYRWSRGHQDVVGRCRQPRKADRDLPGEQDHVHQPGFGGVGRGHGDRVLATPGCSRRFDLRPVDGARAVLPEPNHGRAGNLVPERPGRRPSSTRRATWSPPSWRAGSSISVPRSLAEYPVEEGQPLRRSPFFLPSADSPRRLRSSHGRPRPGESTPMALEERPAASPLGEAWAILPLAGAALVATFRSRELGPTQLAFVAFNLLEWGGGHLAVRLRVPDRRRARRSGSPHSRPPDTRCDHRSVRFVLADRFDRRRLLLRGFCSPLSAGRHRRAAASARRGSPSSSLASRGWTLTLVRPTYSAMLPWLARSPQELTTSYAADGPDREHVHLPGARSSPGSCSRSRPTRSISGPGLAFRGLRRS